MGKISVGLNDKTRLENAKKRKDGDTRNFYIKGCNFHQQCSPGIDFIACKSELTEEEALTS